MKEKIIEILKYSTRIMENENHTDYLIDNIDEVADEVADEIVKLCNLRIVSKRSELLIAFLKWRRGEQLTSETITEIETFLANESNLV